MTVEIHFVQGGDEPVLAGAGAGTLSCSCGNALITGYEPDRFLGVGIQCAKCGTVTTTPGLPDGAIPLSAAITADESTEPRMVAMPVPPSVAVIGRTEMDRLSVLFRPVTPAENVYRLSAERLEEAVSAYERYAGSPLPEITAHPDEPFRGLRDHALAWSVAHLRTRVENGSWSIMQDQPTAAAALHVAAFLHFVATWSKHPLFLAMAATAADRGCSLHGLAPFAAAHCLNMMGNRITFPMPTGYPGRIEGFGLVTGSGDAIPVHVEAFDRFDYPFGRPWDHASLRVAVTAAIEGAQGRINLRNPGLLLLSPGSATAGFDQAITQAIEAAMLSLGRKNRGLMAVGTMLLRQQPTPDPTAIRFVYGLLPLANRHYRGENQLQMGR